MSKGLAAVVVFILITAVPVFSQVKFSNEFLNNIIKNLEPKNIDKEWNH